MSIDFISRNSLFIGCFLDYQTQWIQFSMKKKTAKSIFEKITFSLPIYTVCVLLFLPFLLFCFQLRSLAWPQEMKFISVFAITIFQSGASTILSLFLAVLSSCGLLSLAKKKYYPLIEGAILLPGFIPPLLLVLSLMQITGKIIPFPFGLPALIIAQTLSYTGLCAVALSRLLLKEAPHLSEWAYLHGSSTSLFLKKLLKSILLKDIKILFALVFSSCFTSLSFPLLTAGSSFFSLEFFIYEHLKNPQLWPQALSLILFQSFFIFLICWKIFSKSFISDSSFSYKKIYLLPKSSFMIIPLFILFLSLGGLFLIPEKKAFLKLLPLSPLILSASLNSLILSLGAGLLNLFLLILTSLSFQNTKTRKFISSFMPPGISFMGFALLIIPFYGRFFVLIKWILGLSLLIFPWIYRFRGERALDRLSHQVETARFLGAGWSLTFREILWPQTRNIFFLCAGIASFWSCGDFAFSLLVSSGQWNLSLLVYDLASSYRLNEAVLLSWLLILLSSFVLLFWRGVAFIFDKKII